MLEAHAADPPIHVSAAELGARDVELRHVEARGVFDPRYAVYIDNRMHRGRPGFHVVMPLNVGADRYVLVNRGWIAGLPDRSRVPEVRTPREAVTVRGIAAVPGKRIFELSTEVIEGQVWQNLTIERYRKAMPIAVQPFVIQQESALDDGLVREWPAADYGIDRHYGYAFQWFALAATIAVFYTVTHVRKRKR
jgi:surfeit locus 1 family protein